MYRRTNREPPSKPCPYVTGLIQQLTEFRSNQQPFCSPLSLEKWLSGIVESILAQYSVNVTDVLTNVTKVRGAGFENRFGSSGGLVSEADLVLRPPV